MNAHTAKYDIPRREDLFYYDKYAFYALFRPMIWRNTSKLIPHGQMIIYNGRLKANIIQSKANLDKNISHLDNIVTNANISLDN